LILKYFKPFDIWWKLQMPFCQMQIHDEVVVLRLISYMCINSFINSITWVVCSDNSWFFVTHKCSSITQIIFVFYHLWGTMHLVLTSFFRPLKWHLHSNLHLNEFENWNLHSTNVNFYWLHHIPTFISTNLCTFLSLM